MVFFLHGLEFSILCLYWNKRVFFFEANKNCFFNVTILQ